MNKVLNYFLMYILCGFILAGNLYAQGVKSPPDYFPLASGNSWTYQINSNPSNIVTHTVLPGTTFINHIATKSVRDSSGVITNYSNDNGGSNAGIKLHRLTIDGIEVTLLPSVCLSNTIINVGDTCNILVGTASLNIPGQGLVSVNYSSTSSVEGVETIQVPAGVFNTIKIVATINITGTIGNEQIDETETDTFWMAENIGPIKTTSSFDGVTEIAELISLNVDTDADGVNVLSDNCPRFQNPGQQDADGDQIGDLCDNDADNDGVLGRFDKFALNALEYLDSDNDGIGNNADLDDDNDGLADSADNCQLVANVGQVDTDADNLGDECDRNDDSLIANFGAALGIWAWINNNDWTQVHPFTSNVIVTDDIDGNGQADIIIDFNSQWGVWAFLNSSTWTQLHPFTTEGIETGDIDGNGQADVIIDFGNVWGIWAWLNNSTWTQLHTLSPTQMVSGDIDGNGQADVVIDFGAVWGIWAWLNHNSWSQIHALSPADIVIGDIDNSGRADILINFGSPWGVWAWVNNNHWSQQSSFSPERMTTGDLN